jgi:hypothetical protein
MQDGVCPTCWLKDEAHTSRKLQSMAMVGRSAAATKGVSNMSQPKSSVVNGKALDAYLGGTQFESWSLYLIS